ncbi:MAG: RNA polymerase sigma factor [Kiritimatiellae bacterium]|nr:RNA polymerase sigma factor [Kiritimatiellia bacterium]
MFMEGAEIETDDLETIRRVLAGHVDEFERLLTKYRARVFSIVLNHVPPEQADEVAHEAFVRAYRALGRYSRRHPFSHWLSRIALCACHDFWRQRGRDPEIPVSDLSEAHRAWMERTGSAGSQTEFEDAAARREAAEVLDLALARLDPGSRTVVVMLYAEGRTVAEAAGLLDWSPARVKARAHRARHALRKIIRQWIR